MLATARSIVVLSLLGLLCCVGCGTEIAFSGVTLAKSRAYRDVRVRIVDVFRVLPGIELRIEGNSTLDLSDCTGFIVEGRLVIAGGEDAKATIRSCGAPVAIRCRGGEVSISHVVVASAPASPIGFVNDGGRFEVTAAELRGASEWGADAGELHLTYSKLYEGTAVFNPCGGNALIEECDFRGGEAVLAGSNVEMRHCRFYEHCLLRGKAGTARLFGCAFVCFLCDNMDSLSLDHCAQFPKLNRHSFPQVPTERLRLQAKDLSLSHVLLNSSVAEILFDRATIEDSILSFGRMPPLGKEAQKKYAFESLSLNRVVLSFDDIVEPGRPVSLLENCFDPLIFAYTKHVTLTDVLYERALFVLVQDGCTREAARLYLVNRELDTVSVLTSPDATDDGVRLKLDPPYSKFQVRSDQYLWMIEEHHADIAAESADKDIAALFEESLGKAERSLPEQRK